MKDLCLATLPIERMRGCPPGYYCGIVDMAGRATVQVGRATAWGDEEVVFEPSPEALQEFVGIAAATWPETRAGFVQVWLEVAKRLDSRAADILGDTHATPSS